MIFPREFFDLNFRFVKRVGQLTGRPWVDLLLDYTHTYRRFRLGPQLDPAHPLWQAYLAGVAQAADPATFTFQFHCQREQVAGPLVREHAFGCFSYEALPNGDLRLHFPNLADGSTGPLHHTQFASRRAELRAMFGEVRATLPCPGEVIGGSWLYHLPAYCRLFPAEYTANPTPGEDEFPYLSLWGQFLDHAYRIRSDRADEFLRRLSAARTLAEAKHAFPYGCLHVRAPVEAFFVEYDA
jgi:hypothetical protein